MSCPYHECREMLPILIGACPTCRQRVKHCTSCGSANRAFSLFCRLCGKGLPEEVGNWSGFRGGSERLALNPRRGLELPRDLSPCFSPLELGAACRSILSRDGLLIAVSAAGRVAVVVPETGAVLVDVQASGPVTAEPVLTEDLLILGTPGCVSAFSLAGYTLGPPRQEPVWRMNVPGTPIRDLLALDRRLYLRLSDSEGRHGIFAIDGVGGDPEPARELIHGDRLSLLAADLESRRVVFLGEGESGIALHLLDHGANPYPALESRRVEGAPRLLADLAPIAIFGSKVYVVIGEEERLCRLDVASACFDTGLWDDVYNFALQDAWEGFKVGGAGLYFPGPGIFDDIGPMERVQGQPLLVRDCAAVVALREGRLRLYDLARPPRYRELRMLGPKGPLREEISALASFDRYLAIGNRGGQFQVFAFSSAAESISPE